MRFIKNPKFGRFREPIIKPNWNRFKKSLNIKPLKKKKKIKPLNYINDCNC